MTTKSLGIWLGLRLRAPVKGQDWSCSRRAAQGIGCRPCGVPRPALNPRWSVRRDSGTPPSTCAWLRGGVCSQGLGWAAQHPGLYREEAGTRQGPAAGRTRCPNPAAAPADPGLRLPAGRGAGPDAPWLPGGQGQRPGRREHCAYLFWCGGAAVALRGPDLR